MKKYLIVIVVLVILAIVLFMGSKSKKIENTQSNLADEKTLENLGTETKAEDINSTDTNITTNGVDTKKIMHATIKTNKGEIEIEFTPESAPKTVANFTKLATEGFYNGIKFHRVIKGFMIQVGDPLTKDDSKIAMWGSGGPGYKFADELSGSEKYTEGTVAMANAGPNTNGSQFFIVTASPSVALPPSYTVFGHVTKGLDVAHTIENTPTDGSDRPTTPIIIESITLE